MGRVAVLSGETAHVRWRMTDLDHPARVLRDRQDIFLALEFRAFELVGCDDNDDLRGPGWSFNQGGV